MSQLHPDSPVDLRDDSVQALVVDSHPLTRIGLAVLLHRQAWVGQVLLANDRDEAVNLIDRQRPDVAVVDVSEAGPFVSSYLAPLRSARPAMPLVLAGCYGNVNRAQLQAAGGAAVLTPELSVEQVVRIVRGALVGEQAPVPISVAKQPSHELSEREREVLSLLCTGATNREIAAAMHVGTETVKKHAGALYRKLGVRNRTEAVQRATTLLAA
ncbi:MAG: response regulator transcription factor [Solirubrobacterales bacterium]|nr:response regulator transcription factor [Solirubrobacterales bacterium]